MEFAYPAATLVAVIALLAVVYFTHWKSKHEANLENPHENHQENAEQALHTLHPEARDSPANSDTGGATDHAALQPEGKGAQTVGAVLEVTDEDNAHFQEADGPHEIGEGAANATATDRATKNPRVTAGESNGSSNDSAQTVAVVSRLEQTPPDKRGGRPRTDRAESGGQRTRDRRSRVARPEVVCWKKEREWVVAVETPEELRAVSVMQNEVQLSGEVSERGYWPLVNLQGKVTVATSTEDLELAVDANPYLIFKLSGAGHNGGRQVKRVTCGSYLVIVPEHWTRDEGTSGPSPVAPEYVNVEGYRAHFFDVDDSARNISFRDTTGCQVVIAEGEVQFVLIGKEVRDAAEFRGQLFAGSLPCISISNGTWGDVGIIVVGSEGSGTRRWRRAFAPKPELLKQNLPPEIESKEAGWYFLRFYDFEGQLIDSLDFRYCAGLQGIAIHQGCPLPCATGHASTLVQFEHDADWHVQSHAARSQQVQVERTDQETKVTIPPVQEWDRSQWLVGPESGPSVEIEILAERVWWAVGDMHAPPLAWQDRRIHLSRSTFASTSQQALWLRFPKPRWANSVFVGFQAGRRREYLLKVSQDAVAVPLRDFSDCQELERPSESHDFRVWLCREGNSYEAVIGTLLADLLDAHPDLTKCSASRLASALTSLRRLNLGPLSQLAREARCSYCGTSYRASDAGLRFREEALCVIALFFEVETRPAVPRRLNRYRSRARLANKEFPEAMRQVWRRYRELVRRSPVREPK